MQQSKNSSTNANTWPALAWSPAVWFPGFPSQAEAPAKNKGGDASLPNAGMEMALQSINPWLKAMAQTNIEILRLLTRRSQAAVEMTTKAAQCRQPQDLIGLQTQFWQTAVQQQTDAARQIVSSWGSVLPMAGALANSMGQQAAAVQSAAETARDFMAMPESKDSNLVSTSRTPGGDRRSAA